ncbi:transporter [Novosphingobium flavum]|uniref:Transporter n=1 Tax=Novosphingobium flavum TaxID=1778672 RepID=A0A7X1KKX2_9SPHN|nr:gluconate:H+ symporter [Novosphingobium flavum]MBC2664932.1 transporter [Novosphingobium flavum]
MVTLLMIGLAGIALLLVLVLAVKMQPFVALLLASLFVALVAGLPVSELTKTVEEGLGGSLGHIALIVSLGAMIGKIIDESGGAGALARAMLTRFGDKRVPLALTIAGFLVGIPVFFEVGVIMLMPLAYAVARRGSPLLPIALPMCIAILIVHALLPPHPGAVAIAGLLGADLGRMLAFGLPIAAATAVVARFAAKLLARGDFAMSEDIREQVIGEHHVPAPASEAQDPPLGTVLALILAPILMILASTAAGLALPKGSPALPVFQFFGIPFVALLTDVLLCAWLLGLRRGWTRSQVGEVLAAAIPGVSIVIMITGGGAIFAKVLVVTGIGGAVADLLRSTGLPIFLLAFLLTMLIRAVQGPTTVALMTVGGILAAYTHDAGLDANHLALLCLAMGCGGIAFSHVNDAGFWIVTRLLGLNVRDGLRTWTVVSTVAGLAGFCFTAALWLIL